MLRLNSNILWLSILMLVFTNSCKKEDEAISEDAQTFVIYDEEGLEDSYTPLDIVQKSNGDLLFLTEKVDEGIFPTIHMILTDKDGVLKAQQTFDDNNYAASTKEILTIGNDHYIVCMDNASGVGTKIIKLNDNLDSTVAVDDFSIASNANYPLAAHITESGNIGVLTYYEQDGIYQRVTTAGANIGNTISFEYGVNIVDSLNIIAHLQRDNSNSRQLPFFVGQIDNSYYYANTPFNGQLSTLIFDITGPTDYEADIAIPTASNSPRALLSGERDEININGFLPLSETTFLIANYESGPTQLNGLVTLDYVSSLISTSIDQLTNNQLVGELEAYDKLVVEKIDSKIIVGGTTSNGKIVLYSMSGDQVIGKKYLGFDNDFELASYCATQDGGLAVLGQVNISGRFKRIALFKLSASELSNI